MDANSESLQAKAVQVDSSGAHSLQESRESHSDLQWLLAALGAVIAAVFALRYIAPGFLFGLLLGLVLILAAQGAVVWFIWVKVHTKKEGETTEKNEHTDAQEATPPLERQGSTSAEGWVWIAIKPLDWRKVPSRNGKSSLAPPGWAPQKRQAKLHFNMLMLAGPDGEKDIVKLDGCDVRTVSANGGPERKWSKKLPISIQHPERTLFANSKELLIYCSSGFEKESWCNSLRYASKLHSPVKSNLQRMREDYSAFIELVRQMADGGQDWQASDTPGKETNHSSSIGKWRAKLKKGRGRFASWGSAEEAGGGVTSPGARASSPPPKGDSDTEEAVPRAAKVRSWGRKLTFRKKRGDVGERSQGSSMGESVISEDEASDTGGILSGEEMSGGEESGRKNIFFGERSTLSTAEDEDDATDGKVEGENIIRFGKAKEATKHDDDRRGALDGGIRFGNVMFARFFFDMARNAQVGQMIQGRIERKLARVETPSFMGTLKCTHFDLGTKPPLAKAMRVLPSSQTLSGISVEVDFVYQGSAKLTFETRLDMRAYANAGLFKNVSDKQEVEERVELVAAGLASKGLEKTEEVLDAALKSSDPGKKRLKGNFHSAMNNVLARLKPVVQHVTEQVSMVPLTLTVTVLGLEGTARLRIGPPPTDRLWFGFSEMPELELESRPSVGQLNITRNPLAAWMVERLRNLLRDSLVYPQGEDITIPYMMTDNDEIYQGDPPPAWKRVASDVAPPGAPSLVASPKPGLPNPSSPASLPQGVTSQTPGRAGVGPLGNREGLTAAQTPPRANLQPVPFQMDVQSPQVVGNYTRSSEPGLLYQAEAPVGLLSIPAPAKAVVSQGILPTAENLDNWSSDTSSRAAAPSFPLSSLSQPADVAATRVESFLGAAPIGVAEESWKAATPAISSGHKGPQSVPRDSGESEQQGFEQQQLERKADQPIYVQGNRSFPDSPVEVRSNRENAVEVGDHQESRSAANSREGAIGTGPTDFVTSLRQQVSETDTGAQPSGSELHDVSREPTPAARDPFPPVERLGQASTTERSLPRGPSDPWDLVAQAGTRFPAAAIPAAFRNKSPEGPSISDHETSPLGYAGHANTLDEQSGSSRSVVGADVAVGHSFGSETGADVAGSHSFGSETGADVAGGNRKAMMLDLGKKFGLSVRERGRKYLEKGKLGALLNNRLDGEGQ